MAMDCPFKKEEVREEDANDDDSLARMATFVSSILLATRREYLRLEKGKHPSIKNKDFKIMKYKKVSFFSKTILSSLNKSEQI